MCANLRRLEHQARPALKEIGSRIRTDQELGESDMNFPQLASCRFHDSFLCG
jgi:hypothetical protein